MSRFIFILLISINIFAQDFIPSLKATKVNQYDVELSTNCQDDCEASRSIQALSLKAIKKIKLNLQGGKKAGNQICRKLFSAKIKYYKDINKNELHFCLFKDGSYLPSAEYDYILSELTK